MTEPTTKLENILWYLTEKLGATRIGEVPGFMKYRSRGGTDYYVNPETSSTYWYDKKNGLLIPVDVDWHQEYYKSLSEEVTRS